MTTDVAFISCLQEDPFNVNVVSEPVLKVFRAVTVADDAAALIALTEEVTTQLKTQHGESFGGTVDEPTLITLPFGSCALTNADNKLNLWFIGVAGGRFWGKTPVPHKIGYYTFVRIENNNISTEFLAYTKRLELACSVNEEKQDEQGRYLEELESEIQKLDGIVEEVDAENTKLRQEIHQKENTIDELRNTLFGRNDECRKMLIENDRLQNLSLKSLSDIMNLNTEISDLRKKLFDKEREMMSLREDAQFAVRSGNVPKPTKPSNQDMLFAPMANCIQQIQSFNLANLRSRAERDNIIATSPRRK